MTPPLFRWVGSKRHLAERIITELPSRFTHTEWKGRYWEPFCGAAAVFFALSPRRATLSDINAELITAYTAIRSNVAGVIRALEALEALRARQKPGRLKLGNTKERRATGAEVHYYAVRDSKPSSLTGRAARFLYLQAYSFQGLWRENRAGQHNVPYGGRDDDAAHPYSYERLRLAARELGPADLAVADAFEMLKKPKRGDLVYVDSPFLGTYSTYVDAAAWTPQKAEQLAAALFLCAHRGAYVVSSEADTPIIRKLYKGAQITSVESRQSVAASGDARGIRRDVLITITPKG